MARLSPSKSQILAALDLPEDGSLLQRHLLSRQEKRKRGAEYASALASAPGAPLNKRQARGTSRAVISELPAGLLVSTQSPSLEAVVTDATLTSEECSARAAQPFTTASFRQTSSLEDLLDSEFQVSYDAECPLTRQDVGGDVQEQRLAEFVSKSIDNLAQDMHVRDGMKYLGLRDAKDTLPGMVVRLIPHQIIGVSWMLKQEKETTHKGGIMADEMGLGKTVQMIATMAMNMPSPEENNRTTLIVVPAALLHQWKSELESKSNNIFCVHIHHGKTKLNSLSALRGRDIIITTYQTLCRDFAIKGPRVGPEDEARYLTEHGGLLARMKWYRVVLDEAQFIRNRSTRASKVVAQLRTKFRWMLTGTPVTNTLADLYGLIRFGQFHPWNDWQSFHDHIAKIQGQDALLASARAQEILKPILLRRTKDSKLDGKPLLSLPPKSIELEMLQFSTDEREIYDDFEKKAKIRVNRFIREGTIVENHSAVLVMILRLRQLCCHPNLILCQADDYDPTMLVSGESEKELARARKVMGSEWVVKLKRRRALSRARAAEFDFTDGGNEEEIMCPVCHEIYENNGRILKCGHEVCEDCLEDMSQLAIVHDGIFDFVDERQNIHVEKEFGDAAGAKGFRPCPVCKKMNDISPNAIFLSSAFEPTPEELRAFVRSAKERSLPALERKPVLSVTSKSNTNVAHRTRPPPAEIVDPSSDEKTPDLSQILAQTKKEEKPCPSSPLFEDSFDEDSKSVEVKPEKSAPPLSSSQKGKQPLSNKETRKPSQHTVATWRRGEDDMEPSAKMFALIEQLRIAENAGDKTIVYSQWTSMLDLMETVLVRYDIQSLRYDGKMRSEARDATLVRFRKIGGPRVILISTKCGGVGLNLTSANRVVNMDLSWNFAAESQAYDRVHRLGQEKDVFVKRFVVENTIEERMLRLQDVKKGLADAALGEGTSVKLNKLSVREIKALFGMTPAQRPASSSQQPENHDD